MLLSTLLLVASISLTDCCLQLAAWLELRLKIRLACSQQAQLLPRTSPNIGRPRLCNTSLSQDISKCRTSRVGQDELILGRLQIQDVTGRSQRPLPKTSSYQDVPNLSQECFPRHPKFWDFHGRPIGRRCVQK
jgi:hypothetical protein